MEAGESPVHGKPKVRRDWYAIIFASCWLIGWTVAIIAVAVMFFVFRHVWFWPGISITGFFFPVAIFVWIKGVMKWVNLLRNPNATARAFW